MRLRSLFLHLFSLLLLFLNHSLPLQFLGQRMTAFSIFLHFVDECHLLISEGQKVLQLLVDDCLLNIFLSFLKGL